MSLFSLAILVFFAFAVYLSRRQAKEREAKLASMSVAEREAFLAAEAAEKVEREAKEKKRLAEKDDRIAFNEGVPQAINVARSEGRKYARVWVRARHKDAVQRWGLQHGLCVLVVKYGRSGDVQLSVSGFR